MYVILNFSFDHLVLYSRKFILESNMMNQFFLIFLSTIVLSIAQGGAPLTEPIRYARLHGTIEKITVNDLKSMKSAIEPRREKVCDIDFKIPVERQFEIQNMTKSSSCSTILQGKPVTVYILGRMYLGTGPKGRVSKKEGNLLFFVESSNPEVSSSFAAGAYSPNVKIPNLSLWFNTHTFESLENSKKIGEQFTIDMTFDDQYKKR